MLKLLYINVEIKNYPGITSPDARFRKVWGRERKRSTEDEGGNGWDRLEMETSKGRGEGDRGRKREDSTIEDLLHRP